MVSVPVQCPYCHSSDVIKAGKQANGTQRYQCQNGRCARRIFLLQYQDRGRVLEVRRQVVDMALNGSGIRDTARVLRMSPTTVIAVLKKSRRAACPGVCSHGMPDWEVRLCDDQHSRRAAHVGWAPSIEGKRG